ncbi:MAG TPA: bifunctional [glutamine synthetase] adenylyltransferase/[glutamine synthetase]-adenylyl-L-tyrosine phosphorylase [Geminicoccaceae bacterium]
MIGSRPVSEGLPRPGDAAAAERGFKRWSRVAPDRLSGGALGIDPERLLAAVFGNSPFLTDVLCAEPAVLTALLERGPDPAFAQLLDEVHGLPLGGRDRLMRDLRQVRRRAALMIGLADLAGAWQLEQTTSALTAFAEAAIGRALDQALLELAGRGEIEIADPERPAVASGLIVLGMGKLGAGELNYSSDVDLIVLFEPDRFRYRGRESPMAGAVRLTRTFTHLLDYRTRDGYVLRTDLRLRPHPPGHPLALSTENALEYYERHGQNWERAALIKARPVAGDLEAGSRFLAALRPFLWRRHLDYAAIRDIHSIKRQINAYRGHGTIQVLGHDIKVGRGGIREIEFFAQTQQLILGGRVPDVREPSTCGALRALVGERWLDAGTADELIRAYRFLRQLEHRLQMVADKQTHRLPERPDQLEGLASFFGFGDGERLCQSIRTQLETVERHYAALFESSLDLGGGGALVFTGTEDDPATLQTLAGLGFQKPSALAARVRAWHHGHIRATRDARARELLTELMPRLLQAIAEQADPDATFERFDEFLSRLPAGVQLFSLFRANPRLLGLVADLMGIAPRLAGHLSHHVGLFDAMLAPDFFEPPPQRDALEAELDAALAQARDLQDGLDATRRWAQGREFQIGLHVLLGLADGAAASRPLTDVAEVAIRALLPRVEAWLAEQHGAVEGGAFCVVGLGKLGSGELTFGSDLDLIFVFDAPPAARSSGPRGLPVATWYARLAQRLVSALTAPTAEGPLFEIDMRLRPSGNAGPVACSIDNFERYQQETAQIWEHQALTRARVVAGDPALAERIEAVIGTSLARPRDPDQLAGAVAAMRARIFREFGDDDPWNLKHVRGGLLEAEFLAQYLQLRHGSGHPDILEKSATRVFEQAAAVGALSLEESARLVRAVRLFRRLQAILRLSIDARFDRDAAPPGLVNALIRAAGEEEVLPVGPDRTGELEARLGSAQAEVRALFERFCPMPDADGSARSSARGART